MKVEFRKVILLWIIYKAFSTHSAIGSLEIPHSEAIMPNYGQPVVFVRSLNCFFNELQYHWFYIVLMSASIQLDELEMPVSVSGTRTKFLLPSRHLQLKQPLPRRLIILLMPQHAEPVGYKCKEFVLEIGRAHV